MKKQKGYTPDEAYDMVLKEMGPESLDFLDSLDFSDIQQRKYTPDEAYDMVLKEMGPESLDFLDSLDFSDIQQRKYTPDEAYDMAMRGVPAEPISPAASLAPKQEEIGQMGILEKLARSAAGGLGTGLGMITTGKGLIAKKLSDTPFASDEQLQGLFPDASPERRAVLKEGTAPIGDMAGEALMQLGSQAVDTANQIGAIGSPNLAYDTVRNLGTMVPFLAEAYLSGTSAANYAGNYAQRAILNNPEPVKKAAQALTWIQNATTESAGNAADTLAELRNAHPELTEEQIMRATDRDLATNIALRMVTEPLGIFGNLSAKVPGMKGKILRGAVEGFGEGFIEEPSEDLSQAAAIKTAKGSYLDYLSELKNQYRDNYIDQVRRVAPSSAAASMILSMILPSEYKRFDAEVVGRDSDKRRVDPHQKQIASSSDPGVIDVEFTEAPSPSDQAIVKDTMDMFNELRKVKPQDMTEEDRTLFPSVRSAAEAFTAGDIERGKEIIRQTGLSFGQGDLGGATPMPSQNLISPMSPLKETAAASTGEGQRSALDSAVADYKRLRSMKPRDMSETDRRTWESLRYAIDFYNKGDFETVNSILGQIYGGGKFDVEQSEQKPVEGRQFINKDIVPFTQMPKQSGGKLEEDKEQPIIKDDTPATVQNRQEEMAAANEPVPATESAEHEENKEESKKENEIVPVTQITQKDHAEPEETAPADRTTTVRAAKSIGTPTAKQRAAVAKRYVKRGNNALSRGAQRNGYYVDDEGRKIFNNQNTAVMRIYDLDEETNDPSFGRYEMDPVVHKRIADVFDTFRNNVSAPQMFNDRIIESLNNAQRMDKKEEASHYQVTKVGNSYFNTELIRDAIVGLGGTDKVSFKMKEGVNALYLESEHGDALVAPINLNRDIDADLMDRLNQFYGPDMPLNTPKSTPVATRTNEVEKEDNFTEGNKDVAKKEPERDVEAVAEDQNSKADQGKQGKYPIGFTYQDTEGLYGGETVNKKVIEIKDGNYYVQEEGKGGADIFTSEEMEREVNERAPKRIKETAEAKIQKEKDDEANAKAAEAKKEHERINGFTDNMSPMQRGKVNAALDKRFAYDGKDMSRREFIEGNVRKPSAYVKKYEGDKGNEYGLYEDKDARYYSQITKTEYDYFNYLKDSGTLDKTGNTHIIRQGSNNVDQKAGGDNGHVDRSDSGRDAGALEDVLPERVEEGGALGEEAPGVQAGRKDTERDGQHQEDSSGDERPRGVDRDDGAVLHNPVSPGVPDTVGSAEEGTERGQGRGRGGEGEAGLESALAKEDLSELEETYTLSDKTQQLKEGIATADLAGENPGNFVITEDLGLGEGTDGEKIKRNVQALRTLMQLRNEKRYPTREEQAAMARYVGWGGLSRVFDSKEANSNNMYGNAQRSLKEILSQEEYNAAKATVTDAHYTSRGVVDAMWRIVRHLGFNGGRALEPTVGIGNFIGLQPTELNDMTQWYASELDTVSGEMASYIYPNAAILHSTGFEDAPFANGVFDLAIGNPPFGSIALTSKGKKYPDLAGMKIHNFIIAKSGEHLRPGGIMSMVVTHRFLDTANPEARDYLADRFKFIGALRLPNDAFAKNAGTEVVTDIIVLQKLGIGEKADKNASWLDVDGAITVDGEKIRVNKYFQDHPNHILGRSAMDGSMYARSGKGGTEYTVHNDGRDIGKAIDDIIATDFAEFAGILAPTKAEQNFTAAVIEQTSLAIGNMRLNEDGKIVRRKDNDINGNVVIEEITPDTVWSEKGYEWEAILSQVEEIARLAKEKQLSESSIEWLIEDSKALYKANGERKSNPNKAEAALYEINDALLSEGENLVWKYNANVKEIEAALGRNVLGEAKYNRLRGLLDLRNKVLGLNRAELSDSKEIERLRKELNQVYDNFVKHFGYVSDPKNLNLLGWDIGAEAGLENNFIPGVSESKAKSNNLTARPPSATKADILSKRINYPVKEITHADSATDALKVSLSERGRPDLAYMAKLTGQSTTDIIQELSSGEHPQIYLDTEKNEYVHADEYLSGNVKKKLAAAKLANATPETIRALEAALPKPKTQGQITPTIRSAWIPAEIFEDFLFALGISDPQVSIIKSTGKIEASASFSRDGTDLTDFGLQFRNKHHDALAIFNAAVAGKTLSVYSTDEYNNRVPNHEATKTVNALVDRMAQVFERWAYSSEERAKQVIDAFNENMNTFTPRKYDGVHYLHPVGVSPSIILRNTQKDAAWRMIQAPTVLLDHVVGAGKTFTIITGIMERKRLGLSKKPLIVVPNHLVTQWAKSFYELYPNANILAASPADFTRKRRRALFARMATGDYDAIIIGHSSLGFIPAPVEDQKMVINEQIALLETALDEARQNKQSGRSVKDVQRRVEALKIKLDLLAERQTDDMGYDIESMGIDYLSVDEAHEFKNLAYATTAPRVVGMNDPKGSKKAFDLNIKLRGVLKRGGSATFATGTPVSNSLVELYTMMQYLAHDELADRNQLNFDAWSGAYTRVETRVEYTPTQTVKQRRVLASVNNLSALRQLYDHFADIITMSDLKRLYREEVEARNKELGTNERTEFPVPKIKTGGRILDSGPIGTTQKEYMDYAVARMKAIEAISGADKQEYAKIDNPLWVMTDIRQMSLDVRTKDPSVPREETSKVNRAASNIKKIYDEWNEQRGTQLVFCDLSTPSKNATKAAKKLIAEAAEKIEPDKRRRKWFLDRISYRPYAEQWNVILERYESILEDGDTTDEQRDSLNEYFDSIEDAETAMLVADSGFSVYDDLKKVLEESGIPSAEIAFIHDYETPAKKAELFDRVNDGVVRVLIGSSAKMGAGMNAQKRLVALHHMDPPWRPSDMWQREGRIVRQGNMFYEADPGGFEVAIYTYSTNGTSDTVMWQILERKANAIEQFRQGEEIDTIEEEGSDADQYADFMATSTGNPIFKQKVEAERKLELLESEIGGSLLARQDATSFLRTYESRKEDMERIIKKMSGITVDAGEVKTFAKAMKELQAKSVITHARYLEEKAKAEGAIEAWSKEDPKERGKKPLMPPLPARANLLHPDMLKASKYARDVKAALESLNVKNPKPGDSVTVPLGGSTAKLEIARGTVSRNNTEADQWMARIMFDRPKNGSWTTYMVRIGETSAQNPIDAYTFMDALSLSNVSREYKIQLDAWERRLENHNSTYARSKEILAMPFDPSELDEARAVVEWYGRQVKFAEAASDIERGSRPNRFIAKERRRQVEQAQPVILESEKIKIDGESYTTNGLSYRESGIQTHLMAVRDRDGTPVIILKTEDKSSDNKEGPGSFDYFVIEQPKSLKGESYSLAGRSGALNSLPKLTAADISRSVPGAQVNEIKGGLIKIGFKNGFTLFVDPSSEEIKIDPAIVKRDYGRDVRPGEIAVGRSYVMSGIGFIDLVAGMTDIRTFDHEYYEIARRAVFSEEDKGILGQDFVRIEDESEAFADFMDNRRGKLTKRSSRIFLKIKDFFAKIRAKLFGRRSEDIFREMAQGEIWNRNPKAREGAEYYRLSKRADEQLKQDAAQFAKQVDDFVAGKIKPRQELRVMQTPLVLQISDERVKALPVVMSQGTLRKIFSKHNLSPNLVKQIPGALSDPIMVLDSEMKSGQTQEGLIVMIELKDQKGGTINVPIVLNSRKGRSYECNAITSVFGRRDKQTDMPVPGWFITQAGVPGRLKYINTKKFSRWVDETGQVLSGRGYNNERLFRILAENGISVNTKGFSQWTSQSGLQSQGGQSIERLAKGVKTEADLAKAQNDSPESYRLIRPSEMAEWELSKRKKAADPSEKVRYEEPPHAKDVSAKGRTKKEQSAWGKIADDLGLERVVEKKSPKLTLKERVVKAKDYIEDQWFNQEAPIRRHLGTDMFVMARNAFDGVDARAQALILHGSEDKSVKSLREIFLPVKGSKTEQEGFAHYAVYKHYVDIAKRSEDAEQNVLMWEKEAKAEEANARKLRQEMPLSPKDKRELENAALGSERYAAALRERIDEERKRIKNSRADSAKYQQAVDELEARYPEWIGMQKELAKFNDYILKKYAEAGIIPKSLYEYLSTNLPNYVPFQRDFGDDSRIELFIKTKGLVNLKAPLKKMTGSKRDILDPIDEILNHVYQMEILTAQQKVAQKFIERVNKGELGDLIQKTKAKASGPGRYVFYVWRNGEKEYYVTEDKALYHAITMANPAANMADFEKVLTVPASVLRACTTNSIGFANKNMERDTFQAAVYGRGFIPFLSTLNGAISVMREDKDFVDYLRQGGAQGLASISNRKRKDIKEDVLGNKKYNPIGAHWRILTKLGYLSEQGTRVGQYKAALKLGYTKEQAAYIQRDLINFLQGGFSAKRLNRHSVFFNAGMQELYKLYNAHFHNGQFIEGATGKDTLRKAVLWLTVPTLLLWAWNNSDDERREVWNEMETWKKNLFWWIIVNKDISIPIAKPFTIGMMYSSIPERFMDYWANKDKRALEGFFTSMMAQMLPSAMPLYAALFMEWMQNRSLFYERDIVPVSEQHLDKSMQYGTYTSEWAKWVGRNIPGVSPRMLEYMVYGVTGNYGKEVSGVVNDIWRGVSGNTRPAKPGFEYIPGSRAFVRSNKEFRISVNRWFEDAKRLESALGTAKKMFEEGSVASMSEHQRLLYRSQDHIRAILRINTGKGGIYSLTRTKNAIAEAKDMTPKAKREAIDQLDAKITLLAQIGMKKAKQFEDAIKSIEDQMEARREEKRK